MRLRGPGSWAAGMDKPAVKAAADSFTPTVAGAGHNATALIFKRDTNRHRSRSMFNPAVEFDKLVRQVLWPPFKALGYKKTGNNYRYYDPAGWGKIVQFQKSQWNSASELNFTVNVSLYLADLEQCYLSQHHRRDLLR